MLATADPTGSAFVAADIEPGTEAVAREVQPEPGRPIAASRGANPATPGRRDEPPHQLHERPSRRRLVGALGDERGRRVQARRLVREDDAQPVDAVEEVLLRDGRARGDARHLSGQRELPRRQIIPRMPSERPGGSPCPSSTTPRSDRASSANRSRAPATSLSTRGSAPTGR